MVFVISLEIFWVFFKIGFLSFGGVFGVLPELERMIVIEKAWMTHELFLQSYVLGQFAPGPNMVMCPLIGYWVGGWSGLVAGFFGIYSSPLVIMSVTYKIYESQREKLWMQKIELSVRPVIVGLLASSTFNIWWSQTEADHSLLLSRVFAILLGIIALLLLSKKKLGILTFIFSFGFVWWGFQSLLHL